MPAVSLVVPTYQRPHFLAEALRSVRSQTFGDFEVLVCDNGADLATEAVVRELGDPRVQYLPRTQNLGMLRNAALGFLQARAELVMKLDDDEVLPADALGRLVPPLLGDPDVSMSFGGVTLVDEQGAPLPDLTASLDRSSGRAWFPEGRIRPATWLVAAGGVQMAGAVLRKEHVDWAGIPEEFATAYDLHATLRAVEDNRAVWFTRAPVVHYRLHGSADTARNFARQALASCAVLREAQARGRHGDREALDRRLAEATLVAGRALTQQGELGRARVLLRESLRLRPRAETARLLALAHAPAPAAARIARARHRRAAAGRRPRHSQR